MAIFLQQIIWKLLCTKGYLFCYLSVLLLSSETNWGANPFQVMNLLNDTLPNLVRIMIKNKNGNYNDC